ncbi:hypothetical protein ACLBXM_07225 [Xanthobacteraceae bacterium A53D]
MRLARLALPVLLLSCAPAGAQERLAPAMMQKLMTHITACWAPPPEGIAQRFKTRVTMTLKPDGTLDGTPRVSDADPRDTSGVYAQSAVRAVQRCAPYDFLPPEAHDQWREITVNFQPGS